MSGFPFKNITERHIEAFLKTLLDQGMRGREFFQKDSRQLLRLPVEVFIRDGLIDEPNPAGCLSINRLPHIRELSCFYHPDKPWEKKGSYGIQDQADIGKYLTEARIDRKS